MSNELIRKAETEKDCNTCEHKTDDSGYCTECYYGDRWQRKAVSENDDKQTMA